MATKYILIARELQQSEATTNYRKLMFESQSTGTQTLYVSKNHAAFTTAGGTVTQVQDNLFGLDAAAADIDTLGDLAFESRAEADTTYIYGLRVVSHDPVADVAAIKTAADSTLTIVGTSGVVLAANSVGPSQLSDYVNVSPMEVQKSEATTARRTLFYRVGTAETQTVTASKAGAAFGAISGTATQVDGNLYKLELAPGDVDTNGELLIKSVGATSTQYIAGVRVVDHDPFADLQTIRQRLVGKSVADTSDGTIKVYDTDGATLLVTLTKTTTGDEVTWTPS
jgi:hypothetical protein